MQAYNVRGIKRSRSVVAPGNLAYLDLQKEEMPRTLEVIIN